jgi:hypothetical protein
MTQWGVTAAQALGANEIILQCQKKWVKGVES